MLALIQIAVRLFQERFHNFLEKGRGCESKKCVDLQFCRSRFFQYYWTLDSRSIEILMY